MAANIASASGSSAPSVHDEAKRGRGATLLSAVVIASGDPSRGTARHLANCPHLPSVLQRLGYITTIVPSAENLIHLHEAPALVLVDVGGKCDLTTLGEVIDHIDALAAANGSNSIDPSLADLIPTARIIALCDRDFGVPSALAVNVNAVVPVDIDEENLRRTILLASEGLQVRSDALVVGSERSCANPHEHEEVVSARLTPKEIAVANLIAQGLPTKGISRSTGMAPNTVSVHINGLMRKLGFDNRTQIAIWWVCRFGPPNEAG